MAGPLALMSPDGGLAAAVSFFNSLQGPPHARGHQPLLFSCSNANVGGGSGAWRALRNETQE